MRNFVKTIMIILFLAIIILCSYEQVDIKIDSKIYQQLSKNLEDNWTIVSKDIKETATAFWEKYIPDNKKTLPIKKIGENLLRGDSDKLKAVWISYQEFNAYRNSVEHNNEKSFRKFFQEILTKSKELGFNTVIVQVRPFGDALYQSKLFPWAACISGEQGKSPGYDPLQIMSKEAHEQDFRIEAWVNPYRVSPGNSISLLCDKNLAKQWATSKEKKRNVLFYKKATYYNPSSEEVRDLIVNGVEEIVKNYDVDGIHMDDYFYPEFSKMQFSKVFDSKEYDLYKRNNVNKKTKSIANWRRENVNRLIRRLYQTCHNYDTSFGISPCGNIDNLRSDYAYYVDIDSWLSKKGYVDYIMPQIYWGITHEIAPFEKTLKRWDKLAQKSDVKLYVGIQLYRLGTKDTDQSDYSELQSENYIQNQMEILKRDSVVDGFCVFSYQYMDPYNKRYAFESTGFSDDRKSILKKNIKYLGYLQY